MRCCAAPRQMQINLGWSMLAVIIVVQLLALVGDQLAWSVRWWRHCQSLTTAGLRSCPSIVIDVSIVQTPASMKVRATQRASELSSYI